jgi:hypothetical protein
MSQEIKYFPDYVNEMNFDNQSFQEKFKQLYNEISFKEGYAYDGSDKPWNNCIGMRKWGMLSACISKYVKVMINNKTSEKDIIENIHQAFKENFKDAPEYINDAHDFLNCYTVSHFNEFTYAGQKSHSEKVTCLKNIRKLLIKHIQSLDLSASYVLYKLNLNDYRDIILNNPNDHLKTLNVDTSVQDANGNVRIIPPVPYEYKKIGDLLIEQDFELIKKDLNETTIQFYANFLVKVKQMTTYKEELQNFMPLVFLKDENVKKYGTLLTKDEEYFSKFISQWIQTTVAFGNKQDASIFGLFYDYDLSFKNATNANYAYFNLIKISEKEKNFNVLGKLLLLKSLGWMPNIKETALSSETLEKVSWLSCEKEIKVDLAKSNRISHLSIDKCFELLTSQAYPYLLKESCEQLKGNQKETIYLNAMNAHLDMATSLSSSLNSFLNTGLWLLKERDYNDNKNQNRKEDEREKLEKSYLAFENFFNKSANHSKWFVLQHLCNYVESNKDLAQANIFDSQFIKESDLKSIPNQGVPVYGKKDAYKILQEMKFYKKLFVDLMCYQFDKEQIKIMESFLEKNQNMSLIKNLDTNEILKIQMLNVFQDPKKEKKKKNRLTF